MQIIRYTAQHAQEWDHFVKESKNGTFLFLRGYMDYHADRFIDHSLLYYNDKAKLIAILPANEKGQTLHSHQGLTYGGFVLSPKVHTLEVGELFEATIAYLRQQGFSIWYYKQIPTIYHQQPSQDEEYWLWLNNATLDDCSLMTVIPLTGPTSAVSASRRNNHNRLSRLGYQLEVNAPITDFWPILVNNLHERFGAKPVHSLDEILLLQSRFPEQIVCCTAKAPDGTVMAGTLLYLTPQVVKAQYTSASDAGKQHRALDFLLLELLDHLRQHTTFHHFDFGTSMLADSAALNTGLVQQKEGFGGRGVAFKIWAISIS